MKRMVEEVSSSPAKTSGFKPAKLNTDLHDISHQTPRDDHGQTPGFPLTGGFVYDSKMISPLNEEVKEEGEATQFEDEEENRQVIPDSESHQEYVNPQYSEVEYYKMMRNCELQLQRYLEEHGGQEAL